MLVKCGCRNGVDTTNPPVGDAHPGVPCPNDAGLSATRQRIRRDARVCVPYKCVCNRFAQVLMCAGDSSSFKVGKRGLLLYK